MTQTILLVGNRQRETAKHLIDRAPGGSVCKIDPPKRTLPQNDKMQAMLSDIARQKEHAGRKLHKDKWKCLFMDAVARETGNSAFKAEWEPSLDGESAVNVGYRSSRLRVAEMSELIEFIFSWGAENGVVFSDQQGGGCQA